MLTTQKNTIGQMDRRITLQTRSTTTNNYEETTEVFDDLQTVFAAVDYPTTGSGEGFEDAVNLASTRVEFTIRNRSDIGFIDRVVYNSENYDIERQALIGRNAYLKLTATLRK